MKKIPLTKGMFAIVDDEDYDYLVKRKWVVLNTKSNKHNFYARDTGRQKRINGKRVTISSGVLMHRLIMGVNDPSIHLDHINGNGLDNRKENLRIATRSENSKNKRCWGSSKYLGVYFSKDGRAKPWRVEIKVNGKRLNGGSFYKEEQAAKAYDLLAEKYHGEFANLNFK